MLKQDPTIRDSIAQIFSSAANDVVRAQMRRISQEPQITSKVVDRMEQAAKIWNVSNYSLSAIAHDFPDRGRGSLDSKTGTDLFIGLRLQDFSSGYTLKKGLLVQSKLSKGLNGAAQKLLVDQCNEMLNRTRSGAFVWLYDDLGVTTVPATEVVANSKIRATNLHSRNLTEFFRDTLDCFLGDQFLINGFEDMFDNVNVFNGFLRELSIRKGLAVDIQGNLDS